MLKPFVVGNTNYYIKAPRIGSTIPSYLRTSWGASCEVGICLRRFGQSRSRRLILRWTRKGARRQCPSTIQLPKRGLEPPLPKREPGPEPGASANSATSARPVWSLYGRAH
jgi:hypothetical protein